MKNVVSIFLAFIMILSSTTVCGAVTTSADSAVVYCKDDGKVYYSHKENTISKIASTTKIMTALIALEYAQKNNKKVRFTTEMIAEGSSMYLKIGEVVTLHDLAIGLLLCSGNDAANATAYAISGGIDEFAEVMNKRAKKIGMKNTCFANPSGLDDPDHYSTAYDMALLMSVAMDNNEFAKLSAMKTATVNFTEPENKTVTYSNHNRLLSMYEYCTGGKTGYTMASGRCLVTSAKKNELTLICVTINDRQDFQDHINLYESIYSKYTKSCFDDREVYYDILTENGQKDKTTVHCNDVTDIVTEIEKVSQVKRKVKLKRKLEAPVKKGTKVGNITYTLDGKVVAEHNIIAAEENPLRVIRIWDYIKEFFKNAFKNS